MHQPTNGCTENTTKSAQQKQLMYEAIKRLTSLDIQSAAKEGPGELEAVINDAVSRFATA